jgi:hypothetical protein
MPQAYDGSGLCRKNTRQSKDRFSQNRLPPGGLKVSFYRPTLHTAQTKAFAPSLVRHFTPGNPDYTARDTMAARFMPPSGAVKDKRIQTH